MESLAALKLDPLCRPLGHLYAVDKGHASWKSLVERRVEMPSVESRLAGGHLCFRERVGMKFALILVIPSI